MAPPPDAPCRKCCDHMSPAEGSGDHPTMGEFSHVPEIRTYINMTILKGDKGDRGDRGTPGKVGHEGLPGPQGVAGSRASLHSDDAYQAVIFDTVFVNLDNSFDMFQGKFLCRVAGVYFFNVNIHTWNFKETYLHIMQNDMERAIVYAQPSDRSIMQSQSMMLELQPGDAVWTRLFKRDRENAIYSDDVDVYITFNGYLIKPSGD
ncbi:hypothetical protein CHARACLAT_011356 [Characodon lateralis]|uniref:C1q domain-containing protein n=1 Tax=Characodon lateralis TaxID=208331 RepID=A0ABU7E0G1_9TELE|nr:hypothetical protein [Characodon lateralis]